jgi:hypothetical protein
MTTRTRGKLTEAKIAKLNEVGLYGDGDGRYLQISNISGALTKSWIFRYTSPLMHPKPRLDSRGRPKAWIRDGFWANQPSQP